MVFFLKSYNNFYIYKMNTVKVGLTSVRLSHTLHIIFRNYYNPSTYFTKTNHIIRRANLFNHCFHNKPKYSYNLSHRTFYSTTTSFNRPNHKLELYLNKTSIDEICTKHNLKDSHTFLKLFKEKQEVEENLKELQSMKKSEGERTNDKELLELIEEDVKNQTDKLNDIFDEILECLVPRGDFDNCNDIVLEISAGVGGLEAMLFTGELRDMYCGFLDYKGWQYFLAENDASELGGVRHCSLLVTGAGAFSVLQHEAGVHRVQRVPVTERTSRMHTSTVSVAVLPQPSDIEVILKDSDLKIETKRAGGAGGQHVNTTDSAVRITHLPTGIVIECQSGRSQIQNKTTALKRLQAKIYERELAQVDSSIRSQRKLQVGTSSRSEKIRTYNYRDDRISDHRLSVNIHNLRLFLEGGELLDKLLTQLESNHRDLQVKQFVDSLT